MNDVLILGCTELRDSVSCGKLTLRWGLAQVEGPKHTTVAKRKENSALGLGEVERMIRTVLSCAQSIMS